MAKSDISLYGCSGTTSIDGSYQTNFEAGEALTDGNVVYFKPNDPFFDDMESYADTSAIQAVYVDSDASHKMVSLEETNYAIGSKALKITSAGSNNENDLVIRTISSRDLSGYYITMVIRGSATSTNFQVRLGSTAGLTSNYRYYNLTLSGTNTYEVKTFALTDMTESGTCDETAITQVGFFHSGTGTETIIVDRIWFVKPGTTAYRLYKADGRYFTKLPAVGFVDRNYSEGAIVSDLINQNMLDGFTGLVPGQAVFVGTSGNIVQFKDALPTNKQKVGTAISPTTIIVSIGNVI